MARQYSGVDAGGGSKKADYKGSCEACGMEMDRMDGWVGPPEDGGRQRAGPVRQRRESGNWSVSMQRREMRRTLIRLDMCRHETQQKWGRGHGGGLPALFSRCSEQTWHRGKMRTRKLIEILSVFCNDVLFLMGVEHQPRLKLTRNQSCSQHEGGGRGEQGVACT